MAFLFRILLFLCLVSSVVACGDRAASVSVPETEVNTVAIQTAVKPKKVYFFAPGLDKKTCRATGGCDCCSAHLIFTNGSRFIFIEYCMMDETYSKGTYTIKNGKLELAFDKHAVGHVYDKAASSVQGAPEKYTIRTNSAKTARKLSLERLECSGQTIFRMTTGEKLYGTVDPATDARELTDYMKKEGVWTELNPD